MTRIPTVPPRPLARALPLGVAAGAVLLAGPAVGPATAAPHTPCPTAGKTIARDTLPNVRVYREGTTLKACLRKPGTRRTVRTLGPWSSGTKVALEEGTVAWTTPRESETTLVVDGITTMDVKSGRRWLKTVRAAPAADAATPASDDRVLRILTDSRATAWVTTRGVVATAVRELDEESSTQYGAGLPGTTPFHVGRRFVLGVAGPEDAARVAKGLSLFVGGEGDECGGTNEYQVRVPAFDGRPDTTFVYATQGYARTDGPCG